MVRRLNLRSPRFVGSLHLASRRLLGVDAPYPFDMNSFDHIYTLVLYGALS